MQFQVSQLINLSEKEYFDTFNEQAEEKFSKFVDNDEESLSITSQPSEVCEFSNLLLSWQSPQKEIEDPQIFKQVPSESQKKNTNFINFLLKIFFKHYIDYTTDKSSKYFSFIKNIKRRIKRKGSNKSVLSFLSILFGGKSPNLYQDENRRIMSKILAQKSFSEKDIIKNNYISSDGVKKQYLIASKIFKIRCRSSSLTSRIQTR